MKTYISATNNIFEKILTLYRAPFIIEMNHIKKSEKMSVENCPKCQSEDIYQDSNLWICPMCSHEWVEQDNNNVDSATEVELEEGVRDANGNLLATGDSVIVVKDLKIKGSSGVVKGGTKVRNIRLTDACDGHDIACKIDGFGSINLKSEYVRKA